MSEAEERDAEVVRFLIDRRPDATVEQVRDTLELMGLAADSASVEDAVARAGYEVLFRADGSSVLRPRDGAPPRPAPEPVPAAPAAPAPADGARPPHPANLAGAVAVAVVVLLVAILAGVAFSRGDDDAADGTTTTVSLPAGGGAQASSPTPPRIAPQGPGSDPDLAGDGVVTDAFDRADGELGALPDGTAWTAVRGTWAIEDGVATVTGGDAGGLNLATLDVGSIDVRAQVTLTTDAEGAALAFRVVDEQNYWLVASAPSFGTVALVHIVDGKATYLGNSGLVDTEPGTVIGVHAQGSTVELLVDGAVATTAQDPAPAGTALGLGTAVEATDAAFDDLTFLPG